VCGACGVRRGRGGLDALPRPAPPPACRAQRPRAGFHVRVPEARLREPRTRSFVVTRTGPRDSRVAVRGAPGARAPVRWQRMARRPVSPLTAAALRVGVVPRSRHLRGGGDDPLAVTLKPTSPIEGQKPGTSGLRADHGASRSPPGPAQRSLSVPAGRARGRSRARHAAPL